MYLTHKGDREPFNLQLYVLFSCITGGNRFIKDIEMMIGNKSFMFWLWWRACWFVISPGIITVSTTSHNAPKAKAA